jgi:tetratricopeptide (TPR) repeat protein
VVYALLRAKWPGTPAWIIPVMVIAAHSLVALQQSMVKRKPQPSDPIGPGSPSQYDWGKTGKAALGAILLYGFIYAESIPGLKFLHGYWFWIVLVGPIAYQLLIARPLNQSLRRGDYNRTLQLVRLTHFYNPSGPEALRISGHALLVAGRYREAEEALRQSLSRSQASEAHGVALEQLGEALMEQGRNEEAMRSFQAALHAFPWRHRPYRGMAEMLLRQGKNPAQALEYIEKIIDFTGLTWRQRKMNGKPQDDYWALKAWALAEMGRASEVPDAIENALKATDPKVRPDVATTHYRIGMAMQALGNLTSANDHFKLAVEFDPKGRRGTQATAALRSAYTHVH